MKQRRDQSASFLPRMDEEGKDHERRGIAQGDKRVFTAEPQRSLRDAELGLIIEGIGFLF